MTQHELIVKYLRDFGSITTYEAFKDLGITKLGTRISEMRKIGFEFSDEWVDDVNRYGDYVRYKRYRLVKSSFIKSVTKKHRKPIKKEKKTFWQRLWGL
ncbi:MAG: helix-turn-helix domain-containing protein [Eubacterium sp.]|nr:helix-turn-helix domain-containing protein [Alphaproteobacteria bacterium]MBQ8981662.1 helix-turn-helix domain-containing protein [Eubacterium sp.]